MRSSALIASLLPLLVSSQDCSIPFTVPLFTTQVESDLWYGNATRFNGGTDSLRLNLYKPVGDDQTARPLVIVIHGGGFTEGHRNELNDYCQNLAAMGWAAATISYRLGFYGNGIFDPPWAYDPPEVRRAIYRAMQDAKGAVRFLKGRHLQDSTSTTNVLMVGFSAGAITALSAAFLDKPAEKPADCGSIGPVQHFLNFYPRPDLGPVEGDLQQNGQDASLLGVVNIFGAMLDTAHLETSNDPALYSYHQTGDPIVGCGLQRPYHGIGSGIPDNYPYLFGSCAVDPHAQTIGFEPGRYLFHEHAGNAHDIHDPAVILMESLSWMRDLFCGVTTAAAGDPEISPLNVFPNPTQGMVTVELFLPLPTEYVIHDALGRQVGMGVLPPGKSTLDLVHLRVGLYVLRIGTGEGNMEQRIVVAR